ncbi:FAD-binding protein [Actinospica durhamensis]|uniref:FAD-binding protein n=1 Tax=Actinospica durhamensis TaxID=1508375 RepID=A0A941IQB1_9ACTN|nr:FAD-binding protein [Actinospica durhamensis]MBR7836039.1 FAD-binding protein [Actinospica durhamensis]
MSDPIDPIRNWAGNVEFHPARLHRPTSLEQLRAVVAGAERIRVLGTGHSFNRIADTDGDLLRIDALPAQVEIAEDRRSATVSAGLRLAELAERLQAEGLALPNLPSLPHISLAGAVATATHGSGDANQNLAAFVRGIRLVDARGEVVELTRGESEGFDGAVVSLGALGVVTHMTVDVQPTFEVAQHVYHGVPLEELTAHREDVFASGYSVSGFTDWGSGAVSVWRKMRLDAGGEAQQPPAELLGAALATEPSHPVPGMPTEYCTAQLAVPGPWHERLPHFRPDFTPSSGKELQSEFFVPRELAAEAFEAVRPLGAHVARVLQISEIRTIAADELWLSPCYQRDAVALHFTWIADLAAVEPVLASIEDALLPLGARPHWGKVFLSGPAAALATYPRAEDFRSLIERRDPAGKFRNAFVDGLFPRR